MSEKKYGNAARFHDTTGFDTEMMEFSEYDDGYGNNISSGDISMQTLVERGEGRREIYREGYDEHPFVSQAQRGKFYAMADRGEISRKVVRHYEKETGKKHLPAKKGR